MREVLRTALARIMHEQCPMSWDMRFSAFSATFPA